MRDDDYIDERPSYFGRIDPYCWFLVIPIWIVSIGLAIMSIVVGLGFAVLGGLVLLVDSWINRPRPDLDYWEEQGGTFSGRERFADEFSRY